MANFANIGIDGAGSTKSRVTNAIALASQRTGVDFGYLLGQAKMESSLNPTAKAGTSSASGLYQFIDQSWLGVINQHGHQYGLGWAANAIGQSPSGQYYVADPELRQQILDLRNHPETASVMAAQHAADNKAALEARLGREAQPVDLYLAHFLGVGGAGKFLEVHDRNPSASGAALFPSAARANRSIFYDRAGNTRSLADIRASFAARLNRGADGALDAGNTVAPSDWLAVRARNADLADASAALEAENPSDFAREQTQRLQNSISAEDLIRPQPQTARLAYLMLATLGR